MLYFQLKQLTKKGFGYTEETYFGAFVVSQFVARYFPFQAMKQTTFQVRENKQHKKQNKKHHFPFRERDRERERERINTDKQTKTTKRLFKQKNKNKKSLGFQ